MLYLVIVKVGICLLVKSPVEVAHTSLITHFCYTCVFIVERLIMYVCILDMCIYTLWVLYQQTQISLYPV